MAGDARDRHLDTARARERLGALAVRGGAVMALTRVVRALIELGSTVVLARLLDPSIFGLFGMALIVTRLVELVRDLGLSAATIQREDIDHAQVSALFWVNALAGLVFSAATLASAPLLGRFFGEPRLVGVVAALATSFALGGLGVQHGAILKRQMRFGAVGAIEIAGGLSGTIASIALAVSGAGVWALVVAPIVASLVSTVTAWTVCGFRPGPPRHVEGLGALVGFGRNLVAFNLVNFFARNLDDILIGRFIGAGALGIYQRSYELMMLPLKQLNTPLGAVAVPTLSRVLEDPAKYRVAFLRSLDSLLLLAAPLTAVMVGCADDLIRVVLGPDWSDAVPVFTILGLSLLTQPLANAMGWLFISQARTGEMFRYGIFASLSSAACFVLGLPWGTVGVAAAYSLGQIVRTPILIYSVTRDGPVRGADIYRILVPHGLGWLTAIAVIRTLGSLFDTRPGLVGLGIEASAGVAATAVVLVALPGGRESLRRALALARQMGRAGRHS